MNKSIEAMVEELFGETVTKSSENFEVANASKTTADAAIASAPGSEDDASRGAGRPSDDHDVPKNDQDGNPAKGYDAVQKDISEEEPEEAKKQAKAVTQVSSEGHSAQSPKSSHDPRGPMFKAEEYAEYQALKKAKADEDLKKSEDLKKVEQETLVKAAVEKALGETRKETDELKKAFAEQSALIKAMAAQPRQSKSVTNIEALEKSQPERVAGAGDGEFSKAEKLDAAEALYKAGQIPMDVVIELDNTGSVFNPQHRQMIEKKLLS